MLVRNDHIYTLKTEEISVERVFNYFFEITSNIIYVVDESNGFVGVITSGAFLDDLKNNRDVFINHDCSVILEKDLSEETEALKKASLLFEMYHITTAIPVLDSEGEILYEIRDEWINSAQEISRNFHSKFERYQKSNYARQETVILQKALTEQDIIVVGTEERFEEICGRLFFNKKRISFIEKLDNAYEFIYCNEQLLIDVSVSDHIARRDIYKECNIGYEWEEFLHTVMYIIECEYASRFQRVIKSESSIVREHIRKYWGRDIVVPLKGIFSLEIRKYLKKNSFNIYFEKGICKKSYYQIDYHANGLVCRIRFEKDLMLLDCIDHNLLFYDLNLKLMDYEIPVLNFVFDTEAYITVEENNRMLDVEYNFHKYILENEKKVENSNSLYYGENNVLDYLWKLEQAGSFYPVKRFENDLIVFRDHKSEFVNIENGLRKTCDQPEEYIGTVYFLGPCTIYGNFVEDSHTIPSFVQKYINESEKKYRVINLGNQIQTNASRLIDALHIKKTDVFVILFPSMVETIEKKFPVIEIGRRFNQLRTDKYLGRECFLDGVYHCGSNGNVIYGEIIFSELKKYLREGEQQKLYKNNIFSIFKKNEMDLEVLYDWDSYIEELRVKKRFEMKGAKIGGIVMNCNPFTKGHRYLIDYALSKVDGLYVFVVEEESSFFSFSDRYEMVRQGTNDLENVTVVRSGKMMISAATFPAYFQKNKRKIIDHISVDQDLRIFAQYIAPVLNIHDRFVGEEPQDYVTFCYNDAMKRILPQFGICVTEIPRKTINNQMISASMARKYYCAENFQNLKQLVPETTWCYLMDIYNKRNYKKESIK